MRKGMFTPADLFRLADKDPSVRAILNLWKHSEVSGEQALVHLCCLLAYEKERLLHQVKLQAQQMGRSAPLADVVVDDPVFPTGPPPADVRDWYDKLKREGKF